MSKNYYPIRGANTPGLGELYISFVTNGTNNPTATYTSSTLRGQNAISSVTRTATGTFLVTLDRSYRYVQHVSATLQDDGTDDYATVGAVSNEGTANAVTIVVYTYNGGTLSDFTSRRVYLSITCKDSDAGA